MDINTTSSKYITGYMKILQFKQNLTVESKILSSIFFACLTGFFAQIKIFLPWTPIPITLQTISIIFSGLILGSWFGSLSQILYLLLGCIGIPWFAGDIQGISVIYSPTLGYLVGFIFTSFFIGKITEGKQNNNHFQKIFFIQLFVIYFFFIYGFGATFLFIWFKIHFNIVLSFHRLIAMSILPFLIGDFIKLIVSFLITEQFWNIN